VYVLVQETSHQENNQDQISAKNQNPISRPDQGNPDNQFDCPECGKTFETRKSVEAHALRSHRIKPASLGGRTATENLGEEEISLDLKKEAQITNQAVALARGQQRLKALDPKSEFLHGGQQQPEGNSPSRVLVDLETAKLIRSMRQETEEQERHNGDSNSQVLQVQRELNDLKDKLAKKDIENLTKQTDDLRQELKELRADVRGSAGAQSDVAVLMRETSNLIGRALENPGVIRNYLIPSENFLRPKGDAPVLHTQAVATPGEFNFLEEMKKHGLVTKITDVRRGL